MSIQEKVNLSVLRYANCWEDADVLLKGLQLEQGKHVLCVASAGDNALALLSTGPVKVHAIDVSEVQLYLAELKQLAFASLDHKELLSFIGVNATSPEQRIKYFTHLKDKLSPSAVQFWSDKKKWIESGIIYQGKFERYFLIFRKYLLPLVHSRKTVNQLFSTTTIEEQQKFYNAKWNSFRWKWLMNMFFSKQIMGKYGRDPEFLKYVDVPVAKYIRSKAEDHLKTSLPKENYFLDMIFNGCFRNSLPFYLRQENFEKIKSNIFNLSFSNVSVETAMDTQAYDAYALSNVFEYVSATSFNEFALRSSDKIRAGSTIALWNLMAPRSFSSACPSFFRLNVAASEELSSADKGFFYSRFLIETRI
jgi:S-adenosylmethionine-diacylglycerol 3-amino-3-carboxypropyl transferase